MQLIMCSTYIKWYGRISPQKANVKIRSLTRPLAEHWFAVCPPVALFSATISMAAYSAAALAAERLSALK